MVNIVNVPSTIDTTAKLQDLINKTGNIATKYVLPSRTITVNAPLKLYNRTELAGAGRGKTIFKLMNNALVSVFKVGVPLLGSKYLIGIEELSFHDFTIHGNYTNQTGTGAATKVSGSDHGKGYHNLIGIGNIANPLYTNSTNCSFYNLDGGYNQGDFLRIEGGNGIVAHDISSIEGGHDVICYACVNRGEIYNIYAKMRSNAAIRLRSSKNIKIHDNTIYGDTKVAYSPGMELQSTASGWILSDIEIYNNYIYGTFGPGIQGVATVTGNGLVTIRNNRLVACGQMPSANKLSGVGGIVSDGIPTLIKNNTIDKSYGNAIRFGKYDLSSTLTTSSTVTGNIITNTKAANYPDDASGAGLANTTGTRNIITSSGNCFYGNKANFYKVDSTNDIKESPLYADDDYHLQSIGGHFDSTSKIYVYDKNNSPCLSSEGELGAWNGTTEASIYLPPPLPYVKIPRKNLNDLRIFILALYESDLLEPEENIEFGNVPDDWEV
jgi:hypothetical protein